MPEDIVRPYGCDDTCSVCQIVQTHCEEIGVFYAVLIVTLAERVLTLIQLIFRVCKSEKRPSWAGLSECLLTGYSIMEASTRANMSK